GGCPPRNSQVVGRHGVRRRPDLGSRASLRRRQMIDLARYQDPLTIQRVLYNASTVGIVGLSGNELRASNFVGYYLKRHGYQVFPANPRETEALGEASNPSL